MVSLERTPTWAVATVCFLLILISICTEYLLHFLVKRFLSMKRRKSLRRALDNIKSELMLLGFVSLLLTVSEKAIANICIPKSSNKIFLPCPTTNSATYFVEEPKCDSQAKASLISRDGAKQVKYLIICLAFVHILSSLLTYSLGIAKMRRWQYWEAKTRTLEYQFTTDPRRFQFARQTSFGKRHLKFWSDHHILRWPACFLRQFYESVSAADYLTLRHGFIAAHLGEGTNFDFQNYITRALDNDFSVVVGISWWVWIFSVIFIFFSAHGFHSHLWLPFIPLLMLLLVGTKLQGIMTEMCLDSHGKSHVVRGTLLVRPSDQYFWLGRPKLLLYFIHFIFFQNSFQLAFFAWAWLKFGMRSCFQREISDWVIGVAVGVLVQFICGYVTLPLYALVAQMGSSMKKTVFTEGVVEGLRKWKGRAKKRVARRRQRGRHGCDCNFPHSSPRASVDAGVDSPPSFRLEAAAMGMASVDCGRLQGAGGNNKHYNTCSDSAALSSCDDDDKLKGKRPVDEPDHKPSSFDAFDWATKIHRNFSRHAM
ncbi:MLO-like protein 12 [Cucurbita pepo subsp. pepo]|uniref:MLO-like protein 12 n=1 Tax=Cucurbita pepo subsp. pepo TaxID=3664 RepID=UPI000C9D5985|nr:MLO-like protein 12 [Cucurbita pepo subsp. pepo]